MLNLQPRSAFGNQSHSQPIHANNQPSGELPSGEQNSELQSEQNQNHENAQIIHHLYEQLGNLTLAKILASRGVVSCDELSVQIGDLLPAGDLMGIEAAVCTIDQAIDEGRRILVVGDFDCDGATSTALVVRVLRQMGAVVDFLVPDRFRFGYGLTKELVQYAYDKYQPNLIITVDNGISSHEGVAKADELGVAVVISDHHLATQAAPCAKAVVNPNQLGCRFASKSLVGVGVAFYMMGVLAKQRRQAGKATANVSDYLDLVALGTVADVGVLDKNNRILVAHGLQKIKKGQCCMGILALLERAGRSPDKLSPSDLGFIIAPRINAAGRMDNMTFGIECLLADDWQTASALAKQLDEFNYNRRQVEQQMRQEAEQMIQGLDIHDNQRAIILYDDSWHQGVIGIVAGRLKERFYKPAVIFAPADIDKAVHGVGDEDIIKASARSITGVHITDVIWQVNERYPKLISHFGGHAMAAGLSMPRANFERFCQAFDEVMAAYPDGVFLEQKYSDGALQADDFSLSFAERLANLTVWGHGFAYPSFDGVFEVLSHRILKDKHLKLTLRLPDVKYPIEAIWFNYRQSAWDYQASHVHILYELGINEFQGSQSLQLMVQDLAVVKTSVAATVLALSKAPTTKPQRAK